jgi:hypothetical protein
MAYSAEYHREYYQKNKERKRIQGKIWADANKEKVRECARVNAKKRREENPEGYRKSGIKWEVNNPEKVLVKAARARALKKDLEFSITHEDIIIPEYCPLLNIKLEFSRNHGQGPKNNSPTLDRIDSSKGYTKDNIWVISALANRIKTDATVEEVVLVAKNLQKLLGKGKDVKED